MTEGEFRVFSGLSTGFIFMLTTYKLRKILGFNALSTNEVFYKLFL